MSWPALYVGERRNADGLRERCDPVCVGPMNCAAELRDVPAAEVRVQRASADALARLEDHDGAPGGGELARRGEPREAGADDRDVGGARSAAGLAGRRGGGLLGVDGEQRGAGGGGADQLAAGQVRLGHGAAMYGKRFTPCRTPLQRGRDLTRGADRRGAGGDGAQDAPRRRPALVADHEERVQDQRRRRAAGERARAAPSRSRRARARPRGRRAAPGGPRRRRGGGRRRRAATRTGRTRGRPARSRRGPSGEHHVNPWRSSSRALAAVSAPPGGRKPATPSTPSAAKAARPRPRRASSRAGSRSPHASWRQACIATSWPRAAIPRTASGYSSQFSASTQNVARSPRSSSSSSRRGSATVTDGWRPSGASSGHSPRSRSAASPRLSNVSAICTEGQVLAGATA